MAERHLDDAELRLLAGLGRGPDARSTGIPSGRGAPGWIAAANAHCGRCGERLVLTALPGETRERNACPACAHVAYVNPRLVVTTLPIDAEGRVVLIRRGIEPGRGQWAQPGGFLEIDESVGEAAARETLEETGILVRPGWLVGLYSRLEAGVVVAVLEAEVVGGRARTTPEALEVRPFAASAIPWPELAFTTTWWALHDWVRRRHPGLPVPDAPSGS